MHLDPYIRSPLTEVFHPSIYTNQYNRNELCRKLEINLAKCLEAYGYRRGLMGECRDFQDDLKECTLQLKQVINILFL